MMAPVSTRSIRPWPSASARRAATSSIWRSATTRCTRSTWSRPRVRAFGLDGRDQQPTPDTLLVRTGAPIGAGPHRLAAPVAIQYLSGSRPDPGVLAIVDQTRAVVEVGHDRRRQPAPGAEQRVVARAWRTGRRPRRPPVRARQRRASSCSSTRRSTSAPVDPPRLMLDGASAPDLAFDQAAEVVGQQDQIYVRMDDGTLRRFDAQGAEQDFVVRPPDDRADVGRAPSRPIARAGCTWPTRPTRASCTPPPTATCCASCATRRWPGCARSDPAPTAGACTVWCRRACSCSTCPRRRAAVHL